MSAVRPESATPGAFAAVVWLVEAGVVDRFVVL